MRTAATLLLIILASISSLRAQSMEMLRAGTWELRSFDTIGGGSWPAIPSGYGVPDIPTIYFSLAPCTSPKGFLHAATGSLTCNCFSGGYRLWGVDSIDIGIGGFTLVNCAGLNAQENEYRTALNRVTTYAVWRDSLRLFYDGGKMALSFGRPKPDVRFVHLAAGHGALDLEIDGVVSSEGRGVAFATVSKTTPVSRGVHSVGVAPAGGDATWKQTFEARLHDGYSIVSIGTGEGKSIVVPSASRRYLPDDSAQARIVQLLPDADVALIDVAGGRAPSERFSFGDYGAYRLFPYGELVVEVRLYGDTIPHRFIGALRAPSTTLFIVQIGDSKGLSVYAQADDPDRFGYELTRFRRAGEPAGLLSIVNLDEEPFSIIIDGHRDTIEAEGRVHRSAVGMVDADVDGIEGGRTPHSPEYRVGPDSVTIVGFARGDGGVEKRLILESPLSSDMPSDKSRVRLISLVPGGPASMQVDGPGQTSLTGVAPLRPVGTINAGPIEVTFTPEVAPGSAMRYRGELRGGHNVTIVFVQSLSGGKVHAYLIRETDSTEVRIQRLDPMPPPPDTSGSGKRGGVRIVNVFDGAVMSAVVESDTLQHLGRHMAGAVIADGAVLASLRIKLLTGDRSSTIATPQTSLDTLSTVIARPFSSSPYAVLTTPLGVQPPPGKGMLRVVSAVVDGRTVVLHAKTEDGGRVVVGGAVDGGWTGYRPIAAGETMALLYPGGLTPGAPLPDPLFSGRTTIPDGAYVTAIVTGSRDGGYMIHILIDSDPAAQAPMTLAEPIAAHVSESDVDGDEEIRIVPNPARDELKITWPQATREVSIIELVDARGAIVLRREPGRAAQAGSLVVPTRGIPAGAYRLVFRAVDGRILNNVPVVVAR